MKKKQEIIKERMSYWEQGFIEGSRITLELIDKELILPEVTKNRLKQEFDALLREVVRLEKLDLMTKEL